MKFQGEGDCVLGNFPSNAIKFTASAWDNGVTETSVTLQLTPSPDRAFFSVFDNVGTEIIRFGNNSSGPGKDFTLSSDDSGGPLILNIGQEFLGEEQVGIRFKRAATVPAIADYGLGLSGDLFVVVRDFNLRPCTWAPLTAACSSANWLPIRRRTHPRTPASKFGV